MTENEKNEKSHTHNTHGNLIFKSLIFQNKKNLPQNYYRNIKNS
jgi:hypothetical protein